MRRLPNILINVCVYVCVFGPVTFQCKDICLCSTFSVGWNSPACVHASVVLSCRGFRWSSTKKHLPASLQYYISEARTDGATIRTGSDAAFMDHVPLETRTPHFTGTNSTVIHRVVRALQGSLSYIFFVSNYSSVGNKHDLSGGICSDISINPSVLR